MEQGFRLEKIFDKYALYDKNNNHWFLDKFTNRRKREFKFRNILHRIKIERKRD